MRKCYIVAHGTEIRSTDSMDLAAHAHCSIDIIGKMTLAIGLAAEKQKCTRLNEIRSLDFGMRSTRTHRRLKRSLWRIKYIISQLTTSEQRHSV